jgi:hypothetical protein
MHVGIALTLRDSALLSLVACASWCIFLPLGAGTNCRFCHESKASSVSAEYPWYRTLLSIALIGGAMLAGNLWLETIIQKPAIRVSSILGTRLLLHNRWNVFVGAEEYVT